MWEILKESPLPAMIAIGQQLAKLEAEHCDSLYYSSLFSQRACRGDPSADYTLWRKLPSICPVMDQKGRNYGDRWDSECRSFQRESLLKWGIEGILPDKEHQSYVMDLIYQDVKAGRPVEMDKL